MFNTFCDYLSIAPEHPIRGRATQAEMALITLTGPRFIEIGLALVNAGIWIHVVRLFLA